MIGKRISSLSVCVVQCRRTWPVPSSQNQLCLALTSWLCQLLTSSDELFFSFVRHGHAVPAAAGRVLAGMTGAILRGVPGTNQWEVQAVVAVWQREGEKILRARGNSMYRPGRVPAAKRTAQCRPTESDCAANRTHFASHQRGPGPPGPIFRHDPNGAVVRAEDRGPGGLRTGLDWTSDSDRHFPQSQTSLCTDSDPFLKGYSVR